MKVIKIPYIDQLPCSVHEVSEPENENHIKHREREMHRYFIYLGYDGTRYHGWQIQPNGISIQ